MKHDEWFTPPDIIERVVKVLGNRYYDPFLPGDTWLGRDVHYFLDRLASGSHAVYMNPPALDRGRGVRAAWDALNIAVSVGLVSHAIFAGFNISCLRTCNDMLQYPLCVPRSRVKWIDGSGAGKNSPRYDNAFVYVRGPLDRTKNFLKAFGSLGYCANGGER